MLFLTFALSVPATIVRGEAKLDDAGDKWCCCDRADAPLDTFICVVGDKYRSIVQKTESKDEVGLTVESTDVRKCEPRGDSAAVKVPTKCLGGSCTTKSKQHFFSQPELGDATKYEVPKSKWEEAKYDPTKYYLAEEQDKSHVSVEKDGETFYYAKSDEKTGLAGQTYCVEYRTEAYFQKGLNSGGYNWDWTCSASEHCTKYVSMADACGATFNLYGEDGVLTSEDDDLKKLTGERYDDLKKRYDDLKKLTGELHELVGRKGACQTEKAAKAGWKGWGSKASAAFTNAKANWTASVGSMCSSGTYHTGGKLLQYKFCDCTEDKDGPCK